ncbi:MAG: Smr/MutS family protein [Holophaga sp.]|jgi:hypothetical protein
MTWKKDLAKLKQALDKEEDPPAKAAPPPRPRPDQAAPKSMAEEDDLFLNAMGVRTRPEKSCPAPPPLKEDRPAFLKPQSAETDGPGEFGAAMGGLKGLKPLPAGAPASGPGRKAPAGPPAPAPAPAPAPGLQPPVAEPAPPAAETAPPAPPASVPPPQASGPAAPPQVQINLAAGMAVVVDGSLDLKGHAQSDAEERLKERILDGYALGWRTLHVVVGASPDLRQVVLEMLASPAGRCVARYAQAPVPMGGSQAWILYFRSPGASEN